MAKTLTEEDVRRIVKETLVDLGLTPEMLNMYKMVIETINKRTEELREDMNMRFEENNRRFEEINMRFKELREDMNARFEEINRRFEEMREENNRRFEELMKHLSLIHI